jgi:hypothetical protein
MRRTLLILVLAALAVLACAQTMVRETTVTVAWDAPAGTVGGDAMLPDDVLTYRIWIEDVIRGGRTMVGETASLDAVVTVPHRSVWRVGVSALLDGAESEIAWSTVAEDVAETGTFVLRPRAAPGKPKAMQIGE